jgi:hypothetical protein
MLFKVLLENGPERRPWTSAHFCQERFFRGIKKNFAWSGVRQEVLFWVSSACWLFSIHSLSLKQGWVAIEATWGRGEEVSIWEVAQSLVQLPGTKKAAVWLSSLLAQATKAS